jgi:hypothetical protein
MAAFFFATDSEAALRYTMPIAALDERGKNFRETMP